MALVQKQTNRQNKVLSGLMNLWEPNEMIKMVHKKNRFNRNQLGDGDGN